MAIIPSMTGVKSGTYSMIAISIIQLIIAILFAALVRYGNKAYPQENIEEMNVNQLIPKFMDVHVMIFVGFGFLMTFMKRYVFGGVGFNFLLAALMIQWAILINGFFHLDEHSEIELGIIEIAEADIATAAILISMGAVLGRTTYIQLIFMGMLEMVFFSANVRLNDKIFKAQDGGDSMFVHAFGAYFGLAVGFVLNLRRKYQPEAEEMKASYSSDAFAMIGTLFLWIYWPSFNAAFDIQDRMYRAYINTYLSLASCCVVSFIMSYFLSEEKKFDMVHVQNSTLAGGVAVGAVANMVIHPGGALIIGAGAGMLSVCGYAKLTPLLEKISITDTCGVHNLHGMPGVLSGLLSIIIAATADPGLYRGALYVHYVAMAPKELLGDESSSVNLTPGEGRLAGMQSAYQGIALLVTLIIAILGGLLTGYLLSFVDEEKEKKKHDDSNYWIMHDESMVQHQA